VSGSHAKPDHPRPRPWIVRAAAAFRRHPVRALERGYNEGADRTGMSVGPLIVVGFVTAVVVYVAVTVGPVIWHV
jgi:hypothetical protein